MTYPWANTLLLALIAAAFASGVLGLINGSPDARWLMWVHSAAGFAITVVMGWKLVIVMRVLRRPRPPSEDQSLFVMMLFILGGVLASAYAWGLFGYIEASGTSLMTVHVALAITLVLLLAWHVVRRRWIFRVPAARDRRAFLRLAGVGMAGVALWQGSRLTMRVLDLPGARRRFTGSYEAGSHTGIFPRVSWLFDRPGPVDPDRWRLVVDGAVARPLELDIGQFEAMTSGDLTALIDCTGGWYSVQEWHGVPLMTLLETAGLDAGADSITVESVTGYERRFSMDEASGFLLATHVAGKRLSHGHGYPARLVAPDHRGFEWVKWVGHITVNTTSQHWQPPVPVQ